MYFERNTTSQLNAGSVESLESYASEYASNYTHTQLGIQKLNSVEDAIYEALYSKTLMIVSSHSSCGVQSADCLSIQLSPVVELYESDYFDRVGDAPFRSRIDYYTGLSFKVDGSINGFISTLQTDEDFKSVVEMNTVLSEGLEEFTFKDQFATGLDEQLLYGNLEQNRFMNILKSPLSMLFFSTTVAILIGALYVVWNSMVYDRKKDLLQSHIRSSSLAITKMNASGSDTTSRSEGVANSISRSEGGANSISRSEGGDHSISTSEGEAAVDDAAFTRISF